MTPDSVQAQPATEPASEPDRRTPGRPRSVRADEAIIAAVLDLLEGGTSADALSIEAVAAKAGVGKATIYRRWPKKEALIVDAVISLKGPVPAIRGESVREDLITLLSRVGAPDHQRSATVTVCLLPELQRNETMYHSYQSIVEPRRDVLRQVLLRGVRTGELRADVDVELTALMLTGPLVAQSVLRWNPHVADTKLAERVVDCLLAGISA